VFPLAVWLKTSSLSTRLMVMSPVEVMEGTPASRVAASS